MSGLQCALAFRAQINVDRGRLGIGPAGGGTLERGLGGSRARESSPRGGLILVQTWQVDSYFT